MVKVVCTYTLTEEQLGRIKSRLGDRAELVKVKDFDEAGDVLSEARVLLTNQFTIDQKDLKKMNNLEWIQCVFRIKPFSPRLPKGQRGYTYQRKGKRTGYRCRSL